MSTDTVNEVEIENKTIFRHRDLERSVKIEKNSEGQFVISTCAFLFTSEELQKFADVIESALEHHKLSQEDSSE